MNTQESKLLDIINHNRKIKVGDIIQYETPVGIKTNEVIRIEPCFVVTSSGKICNDSQKITITNK